MIRKGKPVRPLPRDRAPLHRASICLCTDCGTTERRWCSACAVPGATENLPLGQQRKRVAAARQVIAQLGPRVQEDTRKKLRGVRMRLCNALSTTAGEIRLVTANWDRPLWAELVESIGEDATPATATRSATTSKPLKAGAEEKKGSKTVSLMLDGVRECEDYLWLEQLDAESALGGSRIIDKRGSTAVIHRLVFTHRRYPKSGDRLEVKALFAVVNAFGKVSTDGRLHQLASGTQALALTEMEVRRLPRRLRSVAVASEGKRLQSASGDEYGAMVEECAQLGEDDARALVQYAWEGCTEGEAAALLDDWARPRGLAASLTLRKALVAIAPSVAAARRDRAESDAEGAPRATPRAERAERRGSAASGGSAASLSPAEPAPEPEPEPEHVSYPETEASPASPDPEPGPEPGPDPLLLCLSGRRHSPKAESWVRQQAELRRHREIHRETQARVERRRALVEHCRGRSPQLSPVRPMLVCHGGSPPGAGAPGPGASLASAAARAPPAASRGRLMQAEASKAAAQA